MRIGIITYTHGTNFGQRLQNYALQTKLEQYGHQVYTLVQTSPYGYKSEIKQCIKHSIQPVLYQLSKNDFCKRSVLFDKFNRNYIHFYPKKLSFSKGNNWIREKFDAFIVGSDQIWSPVSSYVGNNAFLAFAEDNQKLTYAPSLSISVFPEEKKELYRERLSSFKYLSTREDQGAEILREITGREVMVVVDPTLLISREEWDTIRKECRLKKKKYILEMFIGEPAKEVKEAEEKIGYEIIRINNRTPIDPCEFIDVVAESSFVLTDSFHATVFAAIYRKPFRNCSRSDMGETMNSRFNTLYRLFGIESKMIKVGDNYSDVFDYNSIKHSIDIHKKESEEFLRKELDAVGISSF